MRNSIIAVAILSGGLAACETPATPSGGDLTQLDWVATMINAKPVIEPGRVTLSVSDERVSGRAGCNQYAGPVEFGAGKLKVGSLISTKMACMADGVMQQESVYLTTLQAARSYTIQGDRLVVSTPSGGELTFTGAPRQQRPDAQ